MFLPGQREIARTAVACWTPARPPRAVDVLTLHGELPVEQQSRVLQPDPDGHRRVVLATNVAESSVTLPGVRVVIDSGLAREPRYDPNSGFARLDVVGIAQASADQRAGRAGRVAEGLAYRLWPESQRLEPQRRPEIAQVELAGLALELAAWGDANLRFVDAPPPGALAAARRTAAAAGRARPCDRPTARGIGNHAARPQDAGAGHAPAAGGDAAGAATTRPNARWPAIWRHWWKRVIRCGRYRASNAAMRWPSAGRHWPRSAPAASSPDASRSSLAAIDQAARQWRRRLRLDGAPPTPRAAAPARRRAAARLSRPHRAPASQRSVSLPTGQWTQRETVRRQRAVRRAVDRHQRAARRSARRARAARARRSTSSDCAASFPNASSPKIAWSGTAGPRHRGRARNPLTTASSSTAGRWPSPTRPASPTRWSMRCGNWGWMHCPGPNR